MNTTKLAVIATTLLILLAPAAAIEPRMNPSTADNIDETTSFSEAEVTKSPLFSFLFSALEGPNIADPGQDITLDWTMDTDFTTEGTSNLIGLDDTYLVVEAYDCYDSGCDDPDRDEHIETVRVEMSDAVSGEFAIYSDQSYDGSITYSVPDDANGPHAVTAYLWVPSFFGADGDGYDNDGDGETDEADEAVISEGDTLSRFNVEGPDDGSGDETPDDGTGDNTPDDGSGGDDTATSPSLEAGNIEVQESLNGVEGSVTVTNNGAAMEESIIIEMQVRPQGQAALSWVSKEQTCDPAHPENVHKEVKLDEGETRTIRLDTSQGLTENRAYDVYFLSRDQCHSGTGNEAVEPFPGTYKADTVCLGSCEEGSFPVTTAAIVALLAALALGGVYYARQ